MTVTTSPPGRNNININSTSTSANENENENYNSLSSYKSLNSHSPSTSSPPGMKISPTLVAIRARISNEWKDLVYREALRMTGALRQISNQSNNRSQLVIN